MLSSSQENGEALLTRISPPMLTLPPVCILAPTSSGQGPPPFKMPLLIIIMASSHHYTMASTLCSPTSPTPSKTYFSVHAKFMPRHLCSYGSVCVCLSASVNYASTSLFIWLSVPMSMCLFASVALLLQFKPCRICSLGSCVHVTLCFR